MVDMLDFVGGLFERIANFLLMEPIIYVVGCVLALIATTIIVRLIRAVRA